MITPLSHSNGCLTQKYINSDFDHVINVSDNMDNIKNVETNANVITNVSNNMEAVQNLDTNMVDLLNVSNNVNEIKTVNTNQTEIDTVAGKIDEVVEVSKSITEYQITESITLAQGQVDLVLNKVLAYSAKLDVVGQMVDSASLVKDTDFTVNSASNISLVRSYPAGSIIRATQVVYKADSVIINDLSAFNRKVVPIAMDADISPYLNNTGESVIPRLVVNGVSYINVDSIDPLTVIKSTKVTSEPNGVIVVTTSKGVKRFSSLLSEAVTRKEFDERQLVIDNLIARVTQLEQAQLLR